MKIQHTALALSLSETDQGIDLEVRELQVNVDAVQPHDEINKRILFLLLWDTLQQSRLDDLGVSGEGLGVLRRGDGNIQFERLGVDIADINTTLMCEKDAVEVAGGGDADVVFGGGGMGEQRLDDEGCQRARDGLDL